MSHDDDLVLSHYWVTLIEFLIHLPVEAEAPFEMPDLTDAASLDLKTKARPWQRPAPCHNSNIVPSSPFLLSPKRMAFSFSFFLSLMTVYLLYTDFSRCIFRRYR
jgi:hypothetical protein